MRNGVEDTMDGIIIFFLKYSILLNFFVKASRGWGKGDRFLGYAQGTALLKNENTVNDYCLVTFAIFNLCHTSENW